MGTSTYNYDYDPIGNRLSAASSVHSVSSVVEYVSNELSQYTNILGGAGSPSTPTYDLDGNMLSYGDWNLIQETQTGDATPSSRTYAPAYDANGNITEYIDLADGTIVAHYQYDAFGNTITQSGSEASSFPHRFSTKYTDDETGFLYYGYRYYKPELGRWINRDPIEEEGGLNLYGFVYNRPTVSIDILGMFISNPFQDIIDAVADFESAALETHSQSHVNAYRDFFAALKAIPGATSYMRHVFRQRYLEAIHSELTANGIDASLGITFFDLYLSNMGGAWGYRLTKSEFLNLISLCDIVHSPVDIRYDSIFDMRSGSDFASSFTTLVAGGGKGSYNGKTMWQGYNGTLGRFWLSYEGILCCQTANNCSWTGDVWIEKDTYDFNPEWNWTGAPGQRTSGGERNTRRAYIVDLGTPFDVTRKKTKVKIDFGFSLTESPLITDASSGL
jgi:RHS repeat-associated protein